MVNDASAELPLLSAKLDVVPVGKAAQIRWGFINEGTGVVARSGTLNVSRRAIFNSNTTATWHLQELFSSVTLVPQSVEVIFYDDKTAKDGETWGIIAVTTEGRWSPWGPMRLKAGPALPTSLCFQ